MEVQHTDQTINPNTENESYMQQTRLIKQMAKQRKEAGQKTVNINVKKMVCLLCIPLLFFIVGVFFGQILEKKKEVNMVEGQIGVEDKQIGNFKNSTFIKIQEQQKAQKQKEKIVVEKIQIIQQSQDTNDTRNNQNSQTMQNESELIENTKKQQNQSIGNTNTKSEQALQIIKIEKQDQIIQEGTNINTEKMEKRIQNNEPILLQNKQTNHSKSSEATDNITRQSNIQQKSHSKQQDSSKRQNLLHIEKNLWIFDGNQRNSKANILNKLYYENNQHFAKEGGYNVTIVSKHNAKSLMTPKTREQFEKVAKVVGENSRISSNFALVCVLADNGGIMIDDYFAITEPMQWVENLNSDINIRRGKRTPSVEVFGFYDPKASSFMSPHDIDVDFEVEKMLRSSPGIRPYFLLAKKNTKFLTDLINEITSMVTDTAPLTNKYGIFYYGNHLKYQFEYFTSAVHSLLQKKQQKFDSQKKKGEKTLLAVDHYNLYYINEFTAITKMSLMFLNTQNHVQFQSLARMSKQQIQSYIGPFKYIARLTDDHQMGHLVNKLINKQIYPLVQGSFIQKVLFPKTENLTFIIDNPQRSVSDPNSQPWDTLPRIIWLFWDTGHENAPFSNQLAVQSIKNKAKQSGFEVKLVNNKNIHLYLDNQTLERIEYSIKHANVTVFPQSKSDFIRLALIYAHGGIYFDSSFVAITNFDWLINISRYPSQYIFNRFGKHPKVVMQFHPQYGGVFEWQFNLTANTKVQWQLPIQNNFIAAQKGSEFIKQWFQLHLRLFLMPYSSVKRQFSSCGLDLSQSWASQYLMAMDGAKCVLGNKQKYLKTHKDHSFANSVDYYKLWSLNGFMGFQKYRENTAFQSGTAFNSYVYQYSQEYVSKILGKNFHLTKFYGYYNRIFNNFLQGNYATIEKQAHPQSLLMKYIIPPKNNQTKTSEVKQKH